MKNKLATAIESNKKLSENNKQLVNERNEISDIKSKLSN
jgi:hypothetical protein